MRAIKGASIAEKVKTKEPREVLGGFIKSGEIFTRDLAEVLRRLAREHQPLRLGRANTVCFGC